MQFRLYERETIFRYKIYEPGNRDFYGTLFCCSINAFAAVGAVTGRFIRDGSRDCSRGFNLNSIPARSPCGMQRCSSPRSHLGRPLSGSRPRSYPPARVHVGTKPWIHPRSSVLGERDYLDRLLDEYSIMRTRARNRIPGLWRYRYDRNKQWGEVPSPPPPSDSILPRASVSRTVNRGISVKIAFRYNGIKPGISVVRLHS